MFAAMPGMPHQPLPGGDPTRLDREQGRQRKLGKSARILLNENAMKNIPHAPVVWAAALAALTLMTLPLRSADDEEKISASALKKYDADKNGTLDEPERQAWQADREKQRTERAARHAADLDRYDANKDGKINKDERAIMRAVDAKITAERKAARTEAKATKEAEAEAKLLAKYDKDKNGVLEGDELLARQAADEKHRAAAEKRKATMEAKKQADPEGGQYEPDPP